MDFRLILRLIYLRAILFSLRNAKPRFSLDAPMKLRNRRVDLELSGVRVRGVFKRDSDCAFFMEGVEGRTMMFSECFAPGKQNTDYSFNDQQSR